MAKYGKGSHNEVKKERAELKHQAKIEFEALKNLQTDVARTVAEYIGDENIGFNERVRKLNMSSATVAKLVKDDCKISVDTLAEVLELTGNKINFTHL